MGAITCEDDTKYSCPFNKVGPLVCLSLNSSIINNLDIPADDATPPLLSSLYTCEFHFCHITLKAHMPCFWQSLDSETRNVRILLGHTNRGSGVLWGPQVRQLYPPSNKEHLALTSLGCTLLMHLASWVGEDVYRPITLQGMCQGKGPFQCGQGRWALGSTLCIGDQPVSRALGVFGPSGLYRDWLVISILLATWLQGAYLYRDWLVRRRLSQSL